MNISDSTAILQGAGQQTASLSAIKQNARADQGIAKLLQDSADANKVPTSGSRGGNVNLLV